MTEEQSRRIQASLERSRRNLTVAAWCTGISGLLWLATLAVIIIRMLR